MTKSVERKTVRREKMINIRINSRVKFDVDKCPACGGSLSEKTTKNVKQHMERIKGRCESCDEDVRIMAIWR